MRTSLLVPDMTCGHCAARISTLLAGLPRLRIHEIRLDQHLLVLDHDDGPALEKALRVLADDDYPAEVVS